MENLISRKTWPMSTPMKRSLTNSSVSSASVSLQIDLSMVNATSVTFLMPRVTSVTDVVSS